LTCRKAVPSAYTRRIPQRGMTTGVEEREPRQRVRKRARTRVSKHCQKFCSECGAESAPARRWLPAAGRDRAWAVRTGSGPMRMCGDIFAAARLWRGRLLTTGRLSCRHPIVVCAGRGGKVAVAGRSVAWACSGRGAAICVRVFSSVSHL